MTRLLLRRSLERTLKEHKLTRKQRRVVEAVLGSKEGMAALQARVQAMPGTTAVKDWALWLWEHREEILEFAMMVGKLFGWM